MLTAKVSGQKSMHAWENHMEWPQLRAEPNTLLLWRSSSSSDANSENVLNSNYTVKLQFLLNKKSTMSANRRQIYVLFKRDNLKNKTATEYLKCLQAKLKEKKNQ